MGKAPFFEPSDARRQAQLTFVGGVRGKAGASEAFELLLWDQTAANRYSSFSGCGPLGSSTDNIEKAA
jgi:hypothetical protein